MGAVQNAMQRDGLDPSIMELDPEKSVASQLKKDEEDEDSGPPLKDDPKVWKRRQFLIFRISVFCCRQQTSFTLK